MAPKRPIIRRPVEREAVRSAAKSTARLTTRDKSDRVTIPSQVGVLLEQQARTGTLDPLALVRHVANEGGWSAFFRRASTFEAAYRRAGRTREADRIARLVKELNSKSRITGKKT